MGSKVSSRSRLDHKKTRPRLILTGFKIYGIFSGFDTFMPFFSFFLGLVWPWLGISLENNNRHKNGLPPVWKFTTSWLGKGKLSKYFAVDLINATIERR